ncbi:MAG: hypothetical protein Q7J63_12280, partial [Rhodonellum sp.]|nr:hypothetical protein [Rhodonellum sp.]
YTLNQGFSSPTRLPKLADAATYAIIRNEIAYYNNNQNGLNQVYSPDEIELFRNGSDPLDYPNTNWQRETLQNFALQNQHNFELKYFLSDRENVIKIQIWVALILNLLFTVLHRRLREAEDFSTMVIVAAKKFIFLCQVWKKFHPCQSLL